ncbi:MAG: hypothetical protein ABIN89_19490 [Chitinophagaceae bacterium]
MKNSKWIGIVGVVLLFTAAYQPWITVLSKNITITGMNTSGTNFGRPALMNLIVSGIAGILFLYSSVMAKRANLFFCAFNLAWSIRNYIIVSTCRAGECPEKRFGLYLLMISAIVIILASLFPDVKIKDDVKDS